VCQAATVAAASAPRLRAGEPEPPVVLVIMPPSSWHDIRTADMPNLHAFLATAAVGLLPASSDLDAARHAVVQEYSEGAVALLDLTGERSLSDADLALRDASEALLAGPAFVLATSPVPTAGSASEHAGLGWLAARRAADDRGPGILTSSSTRWPGLVTVADIAPTILDWRDGRDVGGDVASGRVIEVIPAPDAVSRLDALDRMLTDRYRLRFTVGKWYLAYGGLLFALALALGLCWPRGLRRLGAGGLGCALAPVGFLLAPAVGLDRPALHLLVAAGVAAAVALGAARVSGASKALALAMLLGAGLIVVDVLLGSPMMRRSTMGFGVMLGSRFYGIGNEYAGFLGAMTVVGLGALLQAVPRAKWVGGIIGAAVVLVIGTPWWGANLGGAFAAAAGLAALWVLRARKGVGRSAVVVVLVLAASAAIPVGLDLLSPAAERTHIGASAAGLLSGDLGTLGDTVLRKAAMNWGLLVSYRLGFMAGGLLFAAVMWRLLRRGGPARRELEARPSLGAGIFGAVVLAGVAMVVNDSGVVAAAAALGVAMSATIFLASRSAEVRA